MIDPPWSGFDPPGQDLPEFLKFRFSLYMVKDDWPPRILLEIFKVKI